MKTYTKKELDDILELHKKWLNNDPLGKRADLKDVNLRNVYLIGTNLRGANLKGADLRGADLSGADLSGADLSGTNLKGADLNGVNLRSVYLIDTNLRGVNLKGADLSYSYLIYINLSDTDLKNTKLMNIHLWDFIKNTLIKTTPTPFNGSNPNAEKIFKVKSTGKLGFILSYQVFVGWYRGFLDGKIVEFEMSEEVEVLE